MPARTRPANPIKPPAQTAISTAIEGAFLLLLGQTLFGAFAIAFGLIELSSHSVTGFLTIVTAAPERLLYCLFAFALCIILAVTIVIDWAATREAVYELQIYKNKHFILDVCIVALYFTLNNIVFFMSNITTSSVQWSRHVETMLQQPPDKFSLYPGIVYTLFGIYFLLCRWWNPEYIAAKKASVNWPYYGGAIDFGIVVLFLMGFMSVAASNVISIQYVFLGAWIAIIVYLDGIFIYFSRQDNKRDSGAAESG